MPRGSFVSSGASASTLAGRRYRAKHPDRVLATRKTNTKYNREYGWRHRDKLKIEILACYGPAGKLGCSWEGCGVVDPDMLVLDHIADDGAAQKKALGPSNGRGWNFYRFLRRNGFPSGYQTLCCNHNHKKEILRSRSKRKLLD